MDRLLENSVEPAKEGEKSLSHSEIDKLLDELNHGWECIEHHHLVKEYNFDDFVSALDFVNKVGNYAEEVNHHPEITFTWGRVSISIYTHDVSGLREADFVWAANVEQLFSQ